VFRPVAVLILAAVVCVASSPLILSSGARESRSASSRRVCLSKSKSKRLGSSRERSKTTLPMPRRSYDDDGDEYGGDMQPVELVETYG